MDELPEHDDPHINALTAAVGLLVAASPAAETITRLLQQFADREPVKPEDGPNIEAFGRLAHFVRTTRTALMQGSPRAI